MDSRHEPVNEDAIEQPSPPQPETALTSQSSLVEEEAPSTPVSDHPTDNNAVEVETPAEHEEVYAEEIGVGDHHDAANNAVEVETPAEHEEAYAEEVGAGDHHDAADEVVESPHAPDTGVKRGDLIEGTILKTTPTEVTVEIGATVEGVINSRELERLTTTTIQTLQEGAKVLVFVVAAAGPDGRPVLSISRALEESDWREAEEYFQSKALYEGRVSGYNKGGLIVRFGRLRGFVPASQISPERRTRATGENPEERWGGMVSETIMVKVVEIKRARNRLILSEVAATRESRDEKKRRLLEELKVGERRKGKVTSVADFGAFVDIGGADGLVHLTEISWKHLTHPSELLAVGQEVEVEVISVDPSSRRIGLSVRRTERDPWAEVQSQYVVGQLIQASITKLTKFGAFARLVDHPEIEGLIHISELSEHRVRHPREVVSKGDVLTLRIVKIDHDQRRLGLSLKKVDSPEYLDLDWKMADSNLK